jgi:hypothetical protein
MLALGVRKASQRLKKKAPASARSTTLARDTFNGLSL